MCDEYGAYSRCPYKGIPIYIMYKCIHPLPHTAPRTAIHRRTRPRALPHTRARTASHCHTTVYCHTRTAAILPHCHTSALCHTLPHTAALLPDSRTLRCALPHITNNTAAHYRTLAHCPTIHIHPNKFTYIHMDSHK